jgi:hypothetical protein
VTRRLRVRRTKSIGQFHAPRPNALWISDFAYVSTWTDFVYVAFVIDVYWFNNRRLLEPSRRLKSRSSYAMMAKIAVAA